MRNADGFISASACALISPSVCGVSGQVKRDEIRKRQHLAEPPVREHIVRVRAARARIAFRADHAHAERLRQAGEMRADAAEPDDQQRLAAEFVLALAQVGDHAAPVVLGLIVAREMQLARHRKDQRHPVLGDRARIHALRARKPDARGFERLALILVGAGADRLDEFELRRARDQIVAPHHRDADHVRVRDAHGQFFQRIDLVVLDAGVARREAVGHAVGDVCEADRQVVLGRKRHFLPLAPLPNVTSHSHRRKGAG
jgi:hypothetical protein